MDKGFVEGVQSALNKPMRHNDNTTALPSGWKLERDPQDRITAVSVSTLTALADYVKADPDGLDLLNTGGMIRVAGATLVEVTTQLEAEDKRFRRQQVMLATCGSRKRAVFSQYMDHEAFLIMLATQFENTPDREDLLNVLRGIRDSNVRESEDDGLSQQVTVQRGVVLKHNATVPSPVSLKPFRTFTEVDQPASPFVVRLQRGGSDDTPPRIALFEADGGLWEVEAMQNIAMWLREWVPGAVVVA